MFAENSEKEINLYLMPYGQMEITYIFSLEHIFVGAAPSSEHAQPACSGVRRRNVLTEYF